MKKIRIPAEVLYFLSIVLLAFSIALFFKVYLYPQVYDFFVKGLSDRYHLNRTKVKYIFDYSCLAVSCAMTLILFHRFVGVGIGTLVMTVCNGFLIGQSSKLLDKVLDAPTLFPKFAAHFDLEN